MRANIPNCLTCCNLLCGCMAVVCAINGVFIASLALILLGSIFDFADGLVARLLGVSSPIGKELDSLADCVTFGVAPAAMLFCELSYTFQAWIPYIAFLIAAFSAVRLAKFNLDTRQTTSFIGLPTPANALFWASLLATFKHCFADNLPAAIGLIVLMCVSCYLLISEIPMFAMKFKTWGLRDEGNQVKYGFGAFALIVFIIALFLGHVAATFAIIIMAYILLSLILWISKR